MTSITTDRLKTIMLWVAAIYLLAFALTLAVRAQDLPPSCLPGYVKKCEKVCPEGGQCYLACECVRDSSRDSPRELAQLAPSRDLQIEKSWRKPSPAIVSRGTQPVSDPVAPPRALPEESLGDVARRNRTTHPQSFDFNDIKLVCPDGLVPGSICHVENKPLSTLKPQ